MKHILPISLGLGAVMIGIAIILLFQPDSTNASAPAGAQAPVATSSAITMPANSAVAIAATSSCAARIITTSGQAVMLTFSSRSGQAAPTGSYGHIQAASTTVAYDSGLYGCDLLRAYSFGAQALTISESR